MLFHELGQTSHRVAAARGRLDKVSILSALLRCVAPEEIEIVIAYLSGAPRQGRLGIGPALVREARATPPAGEATLTVSSVDERLERMAGIAGKGSARAKRELLSSMFAEATQTEQQFLVRLLLGDLRQGALEGIMIEAVARATGLESARIRRATMAAGDLGAVARATLVSGASGLAPFSIQLFRPVQPMLAQLAGSAAEAIGLLGGAALEYKLDGARIQVHKGGDEVRVYSRRLRDVTGAVPEVVEATRALPARELILDGEVMALQTDGSPYPFQITMRRFGRKLDVDGLRRVLPLSPFLFDVLYVDGDDLTARDLEQRGRLLRDLAAPRLLIPSTVTHDPAAAQSFMDAARAAGHEGIMVKALDTCYEAGSRGRAWLKVKPAHTLDLVVLAAEWGHGRRRGWLSNLHLGARDQAHGGFVMLGKTFKGLSNQMLAWQTERLQELAVGSDGHTVLVRPELVVEVAFNDVQRSPQYPAGLVLRFARVRRYREDKTPLETDTVDAVRAIYRARTGQDPPAKG